MKAILLILLGLGGVAHGAEAFCRTTHLLLGIDAAGAIRPQSDIEKLKLVARVLQLRLEFLHGALALPFDSTDPIHREYRELLRRSRAGGDPGEIAKAVLDLTTRLEREIIERVSPAALADAPFIFGGWETYRIPRAASFHGLRAGAIGDSYVFRDPTKRINVIRVSPSAYSPATVEVIKKEVAPDGTWWLDPARSFYKKAKKEKDPEDSRNCAACHCLCPRGNLFTLVGRRTLGPHFDELKEKSDRNFPEASVHRAAAMVGLEDLGRIGNATPIFRLPR